MTFWQRLLGKSRARIEKKFAYWCDNKDCLFVVFVGPQDGRYCPACGGTAIVSVQALRSAQAARDKQRADIQAQMQKAKPTNLLNTLTQFARKEAKP